VSEETRRLAAGRCIRAIIGLISVTWAIRMMLHAGASGRALITDARGAAMCAEQGPDVTDLRREWLLTFRGGAAEHGR